MGYKEHFILSMAFTGILTFVLGFIVFFRNVRNKLYIIFSLYSLSISWWSLAQIGTVYGPTLESSWFWSRFEHVGVAFIPTLFLHFVVLLLNLRNRKWLLMLGYLLSIIFTISIPLKLLVSHVSYKLGGIINYGNPGPFYTPLILFFVICAIYGLWELFVAYKHSAGLRRDQLRYLWWSSLLGYSGGIGNFSLIYNINIPVVNPFGTYLVGLYVLVVAYAIYKYQLMAIDLAWRYILAYLGYLAVSGIIFLPIILILKPSRSGTIFLILIAFFVVPYLHKKLMMRFQKKVLGDKYNYWDELKDFWENKREVYTSGQLAEVLGEISVVMGLSIFSFFLYNRDRNLFAPISFKGLDGVFDPEQAEAVNTIYPDDALPVYLTRERRIIIHDELSVHADKNSAQLVAEQMDKIKAQVSVPLFVAGKLTAILNLGPKETQEMYHPQDMELLSEVVRLAEKHLAHIAFFESSLFFSGSVAHDISKPFRQGIIYDYVEHIRKGIENPVHVVAAKESLHNLKRLLVTLHAMSKDMVDAFKNLEIFLKSGFKPQKINYLQQITEESKSFKAIAEGKGVVFEMELPEKELFLYADPLSVQRITNELFTNAMKYTDKGKITVKISQDGQQEILTCISDTGCGISQENKDEIWELFKRGKHGQEKEGTGIGLAMVRQLVEANGGKIWVNSDQGNGSNFFFTLPAWEEKKARRK